MIPTNLTYFEVSPETVYDGVQGHLVKLSYEFDIDNQLLSSDVAKYFDFIEEIVFRLEWKKNVSSSESVIITDRELPVYPTKRFMLSQKNKRSAKCFLPRDFLSIEPGFPERPFFYCRISIIPLLTYKKKSMEYQPHGNYYILGNVSEGNPSDYESGQIGSEY